MTTKLKLTVKQNKEKNKQKTNKYKTRNTRHSLQSITILSYNISWESMSGNDSKWALCNNNTDSTNPRHNSVCVKNIANVIDDYESIDSSNNTDNYIDFITLQESTDFKKLIEQSTKLKMMKYTIHKSGLDTITTFWNDNSSKNSSRTSSGINKGYKLLYTIKGEFENGRPWMATVFNKSNSNSNSKSKSNMDMLCLINVHMGHYEQDEQIDKLDNMLIDIKKQLDKLSKNGKKHNHTNIRYVVSGDFNFDMKLFGSRTSSIKNVKQNINININIKKKTQFKTNNKVIMFGGTLFYYNEKHILTCCINRRKHNDHVLDSFHKPLDIIIPDVNFMASDHKPIIVKLK